MSSNFKVKWNVVYTYSLCWVQLVKFLYCGYNYTNTGYPLFCMLKYIKHFCSGVADLT